MTAWARRHPVAAVTGVFVLTAAGVWSVKLARLAHSVEIFHAYWADPRGQPGGLLYVALGDSAAQSIGATRPERGYVGLLAERMRELTSLPVLVVNLSRSGATVRDVLDTQLPRLLQLHPDVVTVAVGGNDIRSYNTARFAADVEELTAALPAGTLVADVPYFMHGRWEDDADQAAETVTKTARAHQLRVVPLHRALRYRGAIAMLTDFSADWFHPNDRGHRVWADALWTELKRSPALASGRARPRRDDWGAVPPGTVPRPGLSGASTLSSRESISGFLAS